MVTPQFDKEKIEDQQRRKSNLSDLWIVPYADFMSVLMVLFLIMFVFAYNSKRDRRYNEILATMQKEMGGTVRRELLEEMVENQAVMQFDEMVDRQNLDNYVTVSYDTEQIKVTMKSPVLFNSGSAELRAESREILHQVAMILKNMENKVIIEGHTDNVPTLGGGRYRTNWELSLARALAVIKYLTSAEELPSKRFAAAGYGEFRPVASNDTPESRGQNRRIEINIVRNRVQI